MEDLNERVTKLIVRAEHSGDPDEWATVAMIELAIAHAKSVDSERDLIEQAVAVRGAVSAMRKSELHALASWVEECLREIAPEMFTYGAADACPPASTATPTPDETPGRTPPG